jgi:hypothetical protein
MLTHKREIKYQIGIQVSYQITVINGESAYEGSKVKSGWKR